MDAEIRRRKPRKKHKIIFAVTALLAAVIILASYLDNKLDPLVAMMAEVKAKNKVSEMINASPARAIEESGYTYSELVNIRYDSAGRITSISADSLRMTELRTKITEYIINDFKNFSDFVIEISLSNVLDDEVILGRMPDVRIPASIDPGAAVTSTLESEFLDAGINQTLHKIYADIKADVCVLTLITNLSFEVNTKVALAETVIVGDIPKFYIGGMTY